MRCRWRGQLRRRVFPSPHPGPFPSLLERRRQSPNGSPPPERVRDRRGRRGVEGEEFGGVSAGVLFLPLTPVADKRSAVRVPTGEAGVISASPFAVFAKKQFICRSLLPFSAHCPLRLCASALNSSFILQPSSFFRPPTSLFPTHRTAPPRSPQVPADAG